MRYRGHGEGTGPFEVGTGLLASLQAIATNLDMVIRSRVLVAIATLSLMSGASVSVWADSGPPIAAPEPVALGAGTAIVGHASGPQGDSWESISKLPNFTNGTWVGRGGPGGSGGQEPMPEGDNRNCTPIGMPSIMNTPLGMEFLFTPGRVTLALGDDRAIRRIYLQPKHADDPDYTFMGESIGHWEGTTLVVDTIAVKSMRGKAPVHLVERMTLTEPNLLQIQQTADWGDHKTTSTKMYERHRDERILEYYCEENPRDAYDSSGHPITIPSN